MSQLRRFLPILCALAICAALPSLPARAARADVANGHVTVIVLDMSGSMSYNDPLGLRCSAANAYIDLSGANPTEATNYVGVIGLANDNATGPSGGAHGFRLAQVWAPPTATNTLANRQQLRQTIATASHGCAPNGNTPTYDALVKAYAMLHDFLAANPGLSGSVILLTDGNPDPQGDAQVADVNAEIVPQFVAAKWPVDTIALGTDTSYRGFLSGISAKTHGTAYDDSQGPVHAVSPLNLARAFADIFREYEGRTLQPSIAPTPVAGQVAKQFFIGDAVTHLDVIAVKDTPATTITLTDPNGQLFQPDQQGNFISTDPHYFIFSLEAHAPAPFLQNGPWTLHVNGSGEFLVDSLTVSALALNVTAPQDGATLPLGQPLTISASVSENGTIVVDKTYDVQALITPPGSAQPLRIFLKDPDATGTYSASVTLPISATPGSYGIDVTATQGTVSAGEQQISVKFALFPTAVLLGANGKPIQPTTPTGCNPVDPTTNCTLTSAGTSAAATGWDGALRWLYTSVPLFDATVGTWHPRDWPLSGYALDPSGVVAGEVRVGTGSGAQPYTNGTVTATATDAHGNAIPVTVENLPGGKFRLHFPADAHGTFNVMLTATGNPSDAFGNPVMVAAPVTVTLAAPPRDAQTRAWEVSFFYLVLLALVAIFGIYGPINYALRPKPSRRNQLVDLHPAPSVVAAKPLVWRRWSLGRYLAPNRLPAGQVGLPNNLIFRSSVGGMDLRVRRPWNNKTPPVWKLNGRDIVHSDGPQALPQDAILALTEGGTTREYRYERLKRSGVKAPPKPPKPQKHPKVIKPPKATKTPKPPKPPKTPKAVPPKQNARVPVGMGQP
jgi:archaellin